MTLRQLVELLPTFRRIVVPNAVNRSPNDAASFPRKYIPLNHTDVIISEFSNHGILDSIWFTCNVGIYVRGIVNKQDRRGIMRGTIPFLQGIDCSWYEMLSQRDVTLPHTAKYRYGHFKNSHSW